MGQKYALAGLPCKDIEHITNRIGRLMRQGHWYRQCHGSKHDSKFWVAASKAYARFARSSGMSRMGFVQRVRLWAMASKEMSYESYDEGIPIVILVNYELAAFRN